MSETDQHPYSRLMPDTILNALESAGYQPDGGMLTLNSYENRVYQIGMNDGPPLVAKFYRPGRWSTPAILEEHRFSLALAESEIPVVAPLIGENGETLHQFEGFRFTLFLRRGGRWPELENPDNLEWIGRFMGRIHQLGASDSFQYRASINLDEMGRDSIRYLLKSGILPPEIESGYRRTSDQLMQLIDDAFNTMKGYRAIRLHGDCHPGNILWTEQGPHFVDLDDCRTGPAIQDLWMLLSGERDEMALQLSYLKEGYETFYELNSRELILIEPLRTLRMIHYAAWLARRWSDPAFPTAFPWFNTTQYWQEHLATLEQQIPALEAPPLPLY
ncbi:serine/threonine protein kinase [Candidatus Vondammii sp. HM_W22]|uniref:serine/threonine protein kinase n=1 Tax=Candidatus Vondammii sp. HM_W22 TaxID=2687299 RepID=UPI001F12D8DF|nr:serine/threonine protein kinase [Candidatus Vondammii sp. HM_W22]